MKLLHPTTNYIEAMALWSTTFWAKNQINSSSTLVIAEIMIPRLHLKTPLQFKSDDYRTKENIKCHFSGLTRKNNFIYLLWSQTQVKLRLTQDSFISKKSQKTGKFKFAKA